MKKSFPTYLLLVLIGIQIVNAVPAGFLMIIEPSGAKLGIPMEVLKPSPFPDFLIPGLFLFVFLGLFPIYIFYGLVRKPNLKLPEKFNLDREYHWALTYAYYLGLLLVLWINMQLLFIKSYSFLQVIISVLGVFIIILTQWPTTRKEYSKASKEMGSANFK